MEQQRFFFYCPFSESSQRKNDRGARQTGRGGIGGNTQTSIKDTTQVEKVVLYD